MHSITVIRGVHAGGASLNEAPPRTTTIGPQFSGEFFWRPFLWSRITLLTAYRTTVVHLHAPRKFFAIRNMRP